MLPSRSLAALAAAASVFAAVLVVGPPASAAVAVNPDVPKLAVGAKPLLPYVDWAAKKIVDGSRSTSIAGIQARVTTLHKVDGGYLLARELSPGYDLVFVATNGARRVLVKNWMPPRAGELAPALAVSRHGDKVIVNTATVVGGSPTYVDTRVYSLPSGTLLRTHDFGVDRPTVLGFGVDRVMLTVYPHTVWWTPATDAVSALRDDAAGQSADLSAWQWAVRPAVGAYAVQGIPPNISPDWEVSQEDFILGPWSPDDTMVAGTNEVDDGGEASSYLVFRVSDGALLLSVRGIQDPLITWESNTTLLLRTRIEGTQTYQLIRCSLGGSCQRVGPVSASRHGAIIPATRRNS